jgi:hypothetical protein
MSVISVKTVTDAPASLGRSRFAALARVACLSLVALPGAVLAAETPLPFVGTWIRADRVCSATAVEVRIYTPKEVTSLRSHCSIRRIASGSGAFELLEDCHHNDRPTRVTEIIRMTSPDSLTLKRQMSRLKIPRSIHFIRCTIAAPAPGHPTH